jgi:hypothetical protein
MTTDPSSSSPRTRAEAAQGHRGGTVIGVMYTRTTVHYFYRRKVLIGIEMMANQRKGFSPEVE